MEKKDQEYNRIKGVLAMHERRNFKNLSAPEEAQLRFFNSYRKISNHIGCYYMGYILEDIESLGRAGFTTNMEWGKEYLANYISHCHLWNQVQKFHEGSQYSSLILPWSTVPASTSLEKDIILRREELYIGSDGIKISKKTGDFREYYYFAPELKQRNFLEYISKNIDIIKAEISIFRKDSLAIINRYNNTISMQI